MSFLQALDPYGVEADVSSEVALDFAGFKKFSPKDTRFCRPQAPAPSEAAPVSGSSQVRAPEFSGDVDPDLEEGILRALEAEGSSWDPPPPPPPPPPPTELSAELLEAIRRRREQARFRRALRQAVPAGGLFASMQD